MILIICYDTNTDITIYNYCRLFNSIFIFFINAVLDEMDDEDEDPYSATSATYF